MSTLHSEPRVVFAAGAFADIARQLEMSGFHKPFIVTTRGRAAMLTELLSHLGDRTAGAFDGAIEHAPAIITDAAESRMRAADPDSIVALGGGSSIGLAKALVLRTSLPLAAIPTTYSGSEVTSIFGMTDQTGKKTGRDQRVAPRLIVYDPDLTMSLSREATATSGINALAHAVEALYAPNATADSNQWAMESIFLLGESLPLLDGDPSNTLARTNAFRGSHLAGKALNATDMGLHHRICHVLGGSFKMPHAKTHSVMLPYVTAFNSTAAQGPMTIIAEALKAEDGVDGVAGLCLSLPVPRDLAELKFEARSVAAAAEEIVSANYANPRSVSRNDAEKILRAALAGDDPHALSP